MTTGAGELRRSVSSWWSRTTLTTLPANQIRGELELPRGQLTASPLIERKKSTPNGREECPITPSVCSLDTLCWLSNNDGHDDGAHCARSAAPCSPRQWKVFEALPVNALHSVRAPILGTKCSSESSHEVQGLNSPPVHGWILLKIFCRTMP